MRNSFLKVLEFQLRPFTWKSQLGGIRRRAIPAVFIHCHLSLLRRQTPHIVVVIWRLLPAIHETAKVFNHYVVVCIAICRSIQKLYDRNKTFGNSTVYFARKTSANYRFSIIQVKVTHKTLVFVLHFELCKVVLVHRDLYHLNVKLLDIVITVPLWMLTVLDRFQCCRDILKHTFVVVVLDIQTFTTFDWKFDITSDGVRWRIAKSYHNFVDALKYWTGFSLRLGLTHFSNWSSIS